MKKIIIIVEQFVVGGVQRLIVNEVAELKRRNYDIFVITLKPEDPNNSMRHLLNIPDANFRFIKFRNARDLSGWRPLLRFLKNERPDVVMTHLWMANNIGRIAAFITGVPKILAFEHSIYDGIKNTKQFTIDRILQLISTKVIAISNGVKHHLIKHGISAVKISVVLNGTTAFFCKKQPNLNNKPPLPTKFSYVFIGRLVEAKAVDVLLRAFARVPTGVLTIVGDGPLRGSLEALASELGIIRRVEFLGSREDISDILCASNCLILPSHREGFGLVIIEAFSAGIPVIVSDFPSAKEIVQDGDNGIIVKRGDPTVLSAAMVKVAEDDAFYERIVVGARKSSEKFSISKHIDDILQIIDFKT